MPFFRDTVWLPPIWFGHTYWIQPWSVKTRFILFENTIDPIQLVSDAIIGYSSEIHVCYRGLQPGYAQTK